MTTVLLSPSMHAAYGEALKAAGASDFVLSDLGPSPDAQALAKIEVAFFSLDMIGDSSKTVLSPEIDAFSRNVIAAPNLRWMHVAVAGADRPIFQKMLARGVRVTTSSGANAAAVAHSVLTGVMMLARGALTWLDAQRRHAWEPLRGARARRELSEQTAIVVGLGPIGRNITALLNLLGVRVIGVRRSPSPEDAARDIHAYAALPALVSQAEWLILACPLSDETRNLVDAKTLAALPPGACVVNVARGGIVDESALIDELRSGRLGGAYLDVFEVEPLPAESAFWDLPNVVISPHSAGSSAGHNGRAAAIFIDNFGRYMRNETLRNEVPPVAARPG